MISLKDSPRYIPLILKDDVVFECTEGKTVTLKKGTVLIKVSRSFNSQFSQSRNIIDIGDVNSLCLILKSNLSGVGCLKPKVPLTELNIIQG